MIICKHRSFYFLSKSSNRLFCSSSDSLFSFLFLSILFFMDSSACLAIAAFLMNTRIEINAKIRASDPNGTIVALISSISNYKRYINDWLFVGPHIFLVSSLKLPFPFEPDLLFQGTIANFAQCNVFLLNPSP